MNIDILVCSKAQAAFYVTGAGGKCHSTKTKKIKKLSLIGGGIVLGIEYGAFWFFYKNYGKKQDYLGASAGLTAGIVGGKGFVGYSKKFGIAYGLGYNVGVGVDISGIKIPIKPVEES